MGQAEIYDVLKANKNTWMNRYDLLEQLPDFRPGRLTCSVTRLRKSGFIYKKVKYEKVPGHKTNAIYPVRYYKIVPKGKKVILKNKTEDDILVV